MIIRLLEDDSQHGMKKGDVKDLDDKTARELISKGIAVREKAIDKEAYDTLEHAKDRDKSTE